MRYLLVGKGDDNPSTRYRLEPLAASLEQLGHSVTFSSSALGAYGKAGLLSAAARSDCSERSGVAPSSTSGSNSPSRPLSP